MKCRAYSPPGSLESKILVTKANSCIFDCWLYAPAAVKCWAYSPPGGLVSKNLTKAMQPFCVSVACGKDAVPRANVANLSRLVEEMMVSLARCRCDC